MDVSLSDVLALATLLVSTLEFGFVIGLTLGGKENKNSGDRH